ncbi:MAG TPA: hypothetical protein VEH10_04580 [Thermoplasmata archaeon]|nr:hypothetical protein [Thermoplasmata archaeon]
MEGLEARRSPHPCIARRCGHATEVHVRTPELESTGETVLWCSGCRRHEVRSARKFWPGRRPQMALEPTIPFRAG